MCQHGRLFGYAGRGNDRQVGHGTDKNIRDTGKWAQRRAVPLMRGIAEEKRIAN
jgi:hypothetical protein